MEGLVVVTLGYVRGRNVEHVYLSRAMMGVQVGSRNEIAALLKVEPRIRGVLFE